MDLTVEDFQYLGCCLEGFFLGLYSGIFALYLHYHGSQKGTVKGKNILFYALCVLYALSVANVIIDIVNYFINAANLSVQYLVLVIQATIFACGDFISQSILIYRCWIVWGCKGRVVVIPIILAFSFLVIWIATGTAPLFIIEGQLFAPEWDGTLSITGLALSMTVNALVTGLIVFRILKVFRAVRNTADDQILGANGRITLWKIIFIVIESGMVLFSVQLARLLVLVPSLVSIASIDAFQLIFPLHEMLNGITPTIILVRVSMGLSFHDESSMVKASSRSLRFAHEDPNSMPENGTIDQERGDNNIEIKLGDGSDIQMVERTSL